MNAQTPRMAAALAYAKTRDLEAAFLAGYAAEGRIGMGKAPTDTDAHKGSSRLSRATVDKREAEILEAIARGGQTVPEVAKATGLHKQVIRDRLNAMQAEGRVRSVGSIANRVKVWEVVE